MKRQTWDTALVTVLSILIAFVISAILIAIGDQATRDSFQHFGWQEILECAAHKRPSPSRSDDLLPWHSKKKRDKISIQVWIPVFVPGIYRWM